MTIGRQGPPRPAGRSAVRPLRLAAGCELWVTYTATLMRFPSTTNDGVTRIGIAYRELGLSPMQTRPVYASNMLLACLG